MVPLIPSSVLLSTSIIYATIQLHGRTD